MKTLLAISLIIFIITNKSVQFPQGAPVSRCDSLEPSHGGAVSQLFPSSYEIILLTNKIGNGQTMKVLIHTSLLHNSFRGFILQARTVSEPPLIVGQFQQVEGYVMTFRDCSGFRSTVTNANNILNTTLLYEWTAPSNYIGKAKFQ